MKYLDTEEKEFIESIGKIDTKNLKKPSKERQKQLKKSARNFLKNETKMNIRIDPVELDKIKEMADTEGLKYQTFVKSVLHKYITGQLIEKKFIDK
jgi:predicted DNA binding CopG/RHH family protein